MDQPTTRVLETLSFVRESADDPRTIEGIAVPYGVVSPFTNFGSEVIAPGAFRESVQKWMTRGDGAKMAYRPKHGVDPVGVVTHLSDESDGVHFRASIFEGAEGDKYLSNVRSGLNGVSIEAAFLPQNMARMKDGTVVQRAGLLNAIAGSISPAYDNSRVLSMRDMETEIVMETNDQLTESAADGAADANSNANETVVSQRDRAAIETRDATSRIAPVGTSFRISRAELVYGPGSDKSFLRDSFLASQGDYDARDRQARHYAHLTEISGQLERAGDLLQSEIPGAIPTEFLPGLATPAVAQTTPMSSFYSTYAINDPRPRTFAKVTTSTAVSTTAKTEGAAPTVTDLATTSVTVTPAVYSAMIDVSREVIDASDPAAESILLYDLTRRFNESIEAVVKTAVEAGSSASGQAITAATPFAGTLANVNAYYATRFEPAQAQFIPSALYQVLLAQADTSGRALLPWTNPFNANGTVQVGGSGAVLNGARVLLSPKSTANVVVTAASSDFVIYRSPMLTFRFSEVVGPQSIRIAVFGYLGIGTRLGSLKVTAA